MVLPKSAFFTVDVNTKRVVHIGPACAHTEEWTAQRLREVTPYGEGPQLLIRDGDTKYGVAFDRVTEGANIEVVPIAPCAPRMCRSGKIKHAGAFHEGLRPERQRGSTEGAVNSVCERIFGGVRRECLEHVIILGEDHLRSVLSE